MHNFYDPFTSAWRFNPLRSQISTPTPEIWEMVIVATREHFRVRQHLRNRDGAEAEVQIQAKIDGKDHEVAGSAVIDCISCIRADRNVIQITGKKNGKVLLTGTVVVASDRSTLTLRFSEVNGTDTVTGGVAVFEPEVS